MANTLVIGMQWGDEGKGKDVDILSEQHKVIIRYQGGGNAGHTIVIGDKKYALHQIPSGILRKDKLNIIGNNVVLDPVNFLDEAKNLREWGTQISPENLMISDRTHLTLVYHKKIDGAKGGKVGTTGRGIGPTYEDKVTRTGIRTGDLSDLKRLEEKVIANTDFANYILKYYGAPPLFSEEVLNELLKVRNNILPFVNKDIGKVILEYNGDLLFEGAQGTMLDVDAGTFPFVTSSNPTIGGAYTGTGIFVDFDKRIGILKAYTTRVGNGPFPTEQENEIGGRLRKRGGEFGTTTGRPRRCGWLDLCIAKYAVRVNGLTEISLTKLDVLDEEETIKVCVGYKIDGEKVDHFPITEIEKAEPVYAEFSGWRQDTTSVKKPKDLPRNARKYIQSIEEFLKTPVRRVGVGERRDQTVVFPKNTSFS